MNKKKLEKQIKKSKAILKDLSKNYWAISTAVLAILLVIILISGGISGTTVSAELAGQKVLTFAQTQYPDAELLSSIEEKGMYQVILLLNGQEAPVYVTKDGTNLVPSLIPLTAKVTASTQQPTQTEIPKSDKPTAELFIMTHCPYGTQAEKGFIPLLESFDKADAQIKFVHYFMHEPEEAETSQQVCIREEQSDKFLPYLREFLKEGNSEAALAAANIDTVKMEICISSGKADEYYAEDSALSQQYGVQGSPTLVINGVIIQSGRDSASYLSAVCSAFNEAPEECETLTLSSAAPSPMWGWDESGSNTAAQC